MKGPHRSGTWLRNHDSRVIQFAHKTALHAVNFRQYLYKKGIEIFNQQLLNSAKSARDGNVATTGVSNVRIFRIEVTRNTDTLPPKSLLVLSLSSYLILLRVVRTQVIVKSEFVRMELFPIFGTLTELKCCHFNEVLHYWPFLSFPVLWVLTNHSYKSIL